MVLQKYIGNITDRTTLLKKVRTTLILKIGKKQCKFLENIMRREGLENLILIGTC